MITYSSTLLANDKARASYALLRGGQAVVLRNQPVGLRNRFGGGRFAAEDGSRRRTEVCFLIRTVQPEDK